MAVGLEATYRAAASVAPQPVRVRQLGAGTGGNTMGIRSARVAHRTLWLSVAAGAFVVLAVSVSWSALVYDGAQKGGDFDVWFYPATYVAYGASVLVVVAFMGAIRGWRVPGWKNGAVTSHRPNPKKKRRRGSIGTVEAGTIKADQVIGQQNNYTPPPPGGAGPTMFDLDDARLSVSDARQEIGPGVDPSSPLTAATFMKATGGAIVEGTNFVQKVWVDENGQTHNGEYIGHMRTDYRRPRDPAGPDSESQ